MYTHTYTPQHIKTACTKKDCCHAHLCKNKGHCLLFWNFHPHLTVSLGKWSLLICHGVDMIVITTGLHERQLCLWEDFVVTVLYIMSHIICFIYIYIFFYVLSKACVWVTKTFLLFFCCFSWTYLLDVDIIPELPADPHSSCKFMKCRYFIS